MKIREIRLKEIAVEILRGLGAIQEEAQVVADCLVQADMRGIDTHGVHLLTIMSQRLQAGMLNIPTALKVLKDDGATALVDGGNGLGQVAVHRAMSTAIAKARQFGLGCCLVRNTNNIGILSFYTLMAAREGMVGMVMSNAAPAMSPWGGAEALFGTNPLSIAIPGGDREPPVVLDMSSSVVARGKIRRADRLKEKIPDGWAFDESGAPTTDPGRALKGTLMPIGGAKGYGLALVVDILAGLLSGSKYASQVVTFHELMGPTGVGVFTLAIDTQKFMDRAQFNALILSYVSSIKGSKKGEGVSRIYLPGEIEYDREKQSESEGVEVSEATAKNLNSLLEKIKSPLRLT
ncbi:MAG TPA: Ldh family oxidoreductase [Syntrophorhabdaceae bacterium]|nr:Ldh family oxidoreductase [Syntrophorhabdaceae bacterium]